jgi:hypothetical protein
MGTVFARRSFSTKKLNLFFMFWKEILTAIAMGYTHTHERTACVPHSTLWGQVCFYTTSRAKRLHDDEFVADLKTAQELLCHANSRITLDVYTRAISADKRSANNRVMDMVIEAGKERAELSTEKIEKLSAPSRAPSKIATVP